MLELLLTNARESLNRQRRVLGLKLCWCMCLIATMNAQSNSSSGSCPLLIYVFSTEDECTSAASSVGTSVTTSPTPSAMIPTTSTAPGTVGQLYADNTCRLTPIIRYNPDELPASTPLLPGRYIAQCASNTTVELFQTGCLQSSCLTQQGIYSGQSLTDHCSSNPNAVASFYSRVPPAPIFPVSSPVSSFPNCLVLTGSTSSSTGNTSVSKTVAFFILGDCSDPSCSLSSNFVSFPPTMYPSSVPSGIASTLPTKATSSPSLVFSSPSEVAIAAPSETNPSFAPSLSPNKKSSTTAPHSITFIPTRLDNQSSEQNSTVKNDSNSAVAQSSSSLPLGTIFGGVFGGLAAFAIILAVGYHIGSTDKAHSVSESRSGSNSFDEKKLTAQGPSIEVEENGINVLGLWNHHKGIPSTANSPEKFKGFTPSFVHDNNNNNAVKNGQDMSYLLTSPTPPVVFREDGDEVSTLGTPIGLAFVDESIATSQDYNYSHGSTGGGAASALNLSHDLSTEEDLFTSHEKVFEIIVPPGKLGMIIDDPNGYPVVSNIKPDSILLCQVQSGDRLLAVDDMDVSNLSCLETSNIIHRKCNKKRRLCFSRGTIALTNDHS